MTLDRAALRKALRDRYPWLADTEHGPQAVEAGECDRCAAEARLVMTCGPGADLMLGRRCAAATGVDAWCSGHEPEARRALRWLAGLPPEADVVARLWWVATGEVRLDPAVLERAVQQVLPGSSGDLGG
jgi:hypothetical protein